MGLMKDFKRFTGTIDFYGEKCQFVFDSYKLTIEVSSFKNINPFSNEEELPADNLVGSIATEPYYAYFAFDKHAYSANFSSKGFSASNIVIYVKYYFVLNKPFISISTKIQLRNNSFQKWLGVYPKYSNDKNPFLVPDKITIKEDTCDLVSSFKYKGLNYKIKPGYVIKSSQVHYNFISTLEIECLSVMNFESIYDLCSLLVKVLRFFFYRYYVSLGDIVLQSPIQIDGKTYNEEFGRFFFKYEESEIEPIDLGKLFDFGFIKWEDFYKHLPKLISNIENNHIYLFHFPEKRMERFRTDFASISTISAAFECEFSRCFKRFETFKKSDANYIDLKEKILAIDATDKQKSIISNILGIYFDSPSLQERAEYALDIYSNVLEEFKQEDKLDLKNIANIFKKTRNKIDHGDLRFAIDDETANAFYYLRIVVLCMQLTRIGVKKEELAGIIRPVLSIEYNK